MLDAVNPWEWLKWFYDVAGHKQPIVSACGFVLVSAFLGWVVWWRLDAQWLDNHPALQEIFRPIYPKYSQKLGKAVAPFETSHTYQAVHEQAMVIWIERQFSFYRLPNDPSKHWTRYPDPNWQAGPEWYRDADLRHKFKPPLGLGPPYGGVAVRWSQDESNWKWIGWREWHCYFYPDQVFLQSFEHGTILGPFRLAPSNAAARLIILLDDGTWISESAKSGPPPCNAPPH